MITLKLGDKGPEVKILQKKLHLLEDGVFGKITEEAVKHFLTTHGLLADGIVGNGTWSKLNNVPRKINNIILHCSATPEGKDYTVDTIRKWHLARGFNDIGYHYVIYRDGTIHKGREDALVGAHCSGHNSDSLGICYIGGCASDGKTAKDTRTILQKQSLIRLLRDLMHTYDLNILQIHCHNEFDNKACPSFKIQDLRKELN